MEECQPCRFAFGQEMVFAVGDHHAGIIGELTRGPKVMEAIAAALGLPDDALELTWRSLAEVGNLSSASVLHVLRDTIAKRPPAGSPVVLVAVGPGVCSEMVLLRW